MSSTTILPKATHTATVIFLHGLGDQGYGWLSAFQSIALPHVKYICPNAPSQRVTLNMGMVMPSWFDIKSLSFDSQQDEEGIKKSSQLLKDLIAEEEKHGISSDRIVIGGFSQGGAVAIHTFLSHDKPLAGLIGLSTWLPLHDKVTSIITSANKNTKIFLGHGDSDPVVKHMFGEMTNKLLSQHYSNVLFNTYSGLQHSSDPKEIKDVSDYLKTVLS